VILEENRCKNDSASIAKLMTASENGFVMPAEWSAQEAVWLSWPVADERHWGGEKKQIIWNKFAEIAANISRFEKVRINAPKEIHIAVHEACQQSDVSLKNLEIYDHPNNDVWCRDHGPIFVKQKHTGEVAVVDWEFNAWGGKFPPWDFDNKIPKRVVKSLSLKRFEGGMILEGGAIEVNGAGQLLTTEAVLLNKNRNSKMSRSEIEQKLRDGLGVNDIFWLRAGIEGDDTDGHIDDLVRFTSEKTMLTCVDKDKSSTNYKILLENFVRLKEFKSGNGSSFEIAEIHMPEVCEVPGWRLPVLPASYVNFLIVNDGVLVPQFRQKKNDHRALDIIRELFPDREIVGIDCLDLVEEGGTLHCISQQQPK
jgi:agmatine deiminase